MHVASPGCSGRSGANIGITDLCVQVAAGVAPRRLEMQRSGSAGLAAQSKAACGTGIVAQ